MALNLITCLLSLYFLPFILTYCFLRSRLDILPSINSEVFGLLAVLVIAIVEHLRTPKIPDVKPLMLLPNMRPRLVCDLLELVLTDFSKLSYFLPLLASLHAVFLINADYFVGLLFSGWLVFIYVIILMSSWMTGVAVRFVKNDEAGGEVFAPSVIFCVIISSLLIFESTKISLYRSALYLCSFLLLYLVPRILVRNIERLLKSVFDSTQHYDYKIKRKKGATSPLPLFISKEIRMCFRSKRIRLLFFIVPLYATVVSVALFVQGNIQGFAFLPYFATTALAMNYNEYWEKYWAWDRNSHGLIFSAPEGKQQYFRHKVCYLYVIGSTVLPVHLLFFKGDIFMGFLGGLIFLIAVSTFTSYSSMENRTMNVELNASIWTKFTFNFRFVVSLLLISAANWYLLFRAPMSYVRYVYLFLVSVAVASIFRKIRAQLQAKEWAYWDATEIA